MPATTVIAHTLNKMRRSCLSGMFMMHSVLVPTSSPTTLRATGHNRDISISFVMDPR